MGIITRRMYPMNEDLPIHPRKYAKDTKGWSLNNHGFCSQETGGKLSLLSGETEKEIFVALGLDYLEPHQRCC